MTEKTRHTNTKYINLAAITAVILCVTWFYFSAPPFQGYSIYTPDSVSGLLIEAPVEYKGVDVGKVKKIDLFNHDWVKIELDIQKKIAISNKTAALISSRGLTNRGYTGYVFVELCDVENPIASSLPPHVDKKRVIPLLRPQNYSLDETLSDMGEDLHQITEILKTLLDKDTILSIKKLVNNLQDLTSNLEKHDKALISLITKLEAASGDIKPFFATTQRTMTTLDHTLNSVDALSNSMIDLTNKLNRDPSIIIRGTKPAKPGPGERK